MNERLVLTSLFFFSMLSYRISIQHPSILYTYLWKGVMTESKATEKKIICLVCSKEFDTLKALSTHLQNAHSLRSKDYTIQYILQKKEPKCAFLGCSEPTRYTSFSFKDFCSLHAKEAMRIAGRLGGQKKKPWNKGKTKHEDERILKQSVDRTGGKNPFFGKKHKNKTKKEISNSKRLSRKAILLRLKDREKDFLFPSFSYENYASRQYQKIESVCVRCGHVSYKTLQSLERGTLCSKCFPFTVSKGELEMGDFIETCLKKRGGTFSVLRNSREIIPPLELDIFIPELNIAFEYHGIYWHMDKGEKGFDKFAHKKKYEVCKYKGISLYQFFSNDWETKPDLVKSMIKSRLGLLTNIGARHFTIDTNLSNAEAMAFFQRNHLNGHVKASKYIGLRDATEQLVQAISLRKPFHKKYRDAIEIARFATLQGLQVAGGFSKLMKEVLSYSKEVGKSKVLSYADLLHGIGNVYKQYGFEYKGNSGLNYWYTDGQKFLNRFSFRTTKETTEKELAKMKGVYRIYGAGNAIYVLEI